MEQPGAGRGLTFLKDKRDLSRAIACAAAISERDSVAKCLGMFMALDQENRFEKVYISQPEEEQQFVVAYAEDAVFIGFQGSKKLKDYACDMMSNKVEKSGTGDLGSYHNGTFQCSDAFFGLLGSRILEFLAASFIELKKRIVFCGHSLGGAVAHMVLMRLLLENQYIDKKDDDPNDMISIAFGAPYLCDEIAAGLINDKPSYKCRFINIVNEQDLVPRLLFNLESIVPEVASRAKALAVATSRLESLSCSADTFLTFMAAGKFEICKDSNSACGLTPVPFKATTNSQENVAAEAPEKTNVYYTPIGIYVLLDSTEPESMTVIGSNSEDIDLYLPVDTVDILNPRMYKLAEHHCMSYLKALLDASLIVGHVPATLDSITSVLPVEPKPEVLRAEGAIRGDSSGYSFHISGKNLQLLRSVTLNGHKIQANQIIFSTETELVFQSDPVKTFTPKAGSLGSLKLKTPFGSSKEITILKRNLPSLLPKLVQSMMLLAAMNEPPNDDQQQRLDAILSHVSSISDGPFLRNILEEYIKPLTEAESKVSRKLEVVHQVNERVKAAVQFMQSNLLLKFETKDLSRFVELSKIACGAAIASPVSGAAVGLGVLATACANNNPAPRLIITAAASAASTTLVFPVFVMMCGVYAWTILRVASLIHKRLLEGLTRLLQYNVLEYEAVLQTAVAEVRLWNDRDEDKGSGSSKSRITEDHLVEEVNAASQRFKAMLEAAVGLGSTTSTAKLEFKGSILKFATHDSIQDFLRRIYAIVETNKLFQELDIGGKHFLAILGEEDAGKPSFIQALLEEGRPRHDGEKPLQEEPEEEFNIHTREVTPYKLKNDMILLDFPGINGAGEYAIWWEEYTALPSLVVLLLNFDNDIKENQIQMYKTIKRKVTETPVIVAFNKVDDKFGPRSKALYLKKDATGKGTHFPNQTREAAAKLGCDSDHIFFVALKPLHPTMDAQERKK
ncbi:hypothetical protein M758_12G135600 [Ceratodon purpureus]|nr:hypothetical protein M758_12G135600 [Ceratodon purpureus]